MSVSDRLVMELLRLGGYLQREGARMSREFGLTQQQFVVLVVIAEQGPISQKAILSDLLYEKSNVSKCISSLLSLDLVDTAKDEEDSRVVLCRVTQKGLKTVESCMSKMKSWNKRWLKKISDHDLSLAIGILERIKHME